VQIDHFASFAFCKFGLNSCQMLNFLTSWFLEVRNFNFFYWIQCFLHFVQYSIYLRESVFALAIYVCMSYMSCSMYAKTLLSFCVYTSFNASMIALLLLRFSTVCELNVWVKHCYCSVDVDEIVQLFWQA